MGRFSAIYFGISRMFARRIIILILTVTLAWSSVGFSATNSHAEGKLSRQLKINRDALLQGASEQLRVDAATELLLSGEKTARQILLDTLAQQENPAGRLAVCKALAQARSFQESIKNRHDFIGPLFEILETQTGPEAKLAAEATLIFEYRTISKQLKQIFGDAKLPIAARLNGIYALKLRPDQDAITELIKLLDDPDKGIAKSAEGALQEA